MACELNYNQLRNAVKNGSRFTVLPADATAQDINDLIRTVDEAFGLAEVNTTPKDKGDDLRRYTLRNEDGVYDTDTFVQWRVTDAAARKFRRNQLRFKTEEELEAMRNDPNNIIKREYGTAVHNVMEQLGKYYYDIASSGTSEVNLANVKREAAKGEYPIGPAHFEALNKNAKILVAKIIDEQSKIDPQGEVTIHFERVIVDPTKDVAGTVDVLAVFSDKTAMIYDYKTFSSKGDFVVGYGNNKRVISRNFAIQSKKESWKEQMSGYRRILMSLYGIKEIRASRVVPIWIDIEGQFNTAKQEYTLSKSLNKLQLGEEMNEYLRNISVGIERKSIPFIDNFLSKYYDRLEHLKDQYRKADKAERPRIADNIATIEEAIYEFVEKDQLTRLIGDALGVATELNEDLDNGVIHDYDTLNDAIDFIGGVVEFVRAFEENRAELEQQQPQMVKTISETIEQLDTPVTALAMVLGRLTAYRMDMFTSSIPDRYGTVERQGQTITMKDDGFLRQTFLPSSEQTNPIIRTAVDVMQRALSKTRADLRTFDDRLAEVEKNLEDWLRSQGQTLYDAHQYLLDANHNMINPIDKRFYEERTKARRNGDVAFFTKHYKIKEKNGRNETFEQFYARRKKETEDHYRYVYRELEKADKDAFDKKIITKMDEWIKRNDLSLKPDGTPRHPDAWLNSHFLELTDEAKLTYENPAYTQIKNVPQLLAYHNFVTEFMDEFRPIVGYDVIRSKNFFPKVRSSIMEKLGNGNFEGIGQDLRAILSIREDEMDFGMYNPNTGSIDKSIPIFFTNPLNDEGQLSNDMGNALRLFAKVMYNYKHMEQVEAQVLAVKEILSHNVQFHKTDSLGRQMFDKFHNAAIKTDSEGATLTEQVFNTYVDYYLYGINMQVFANNPELTQTLMKAKNYFSLKTLGMGFIPGTAGYLAARVSSWVEGQKGLYYTADQWHAAMKEQGANMNKYHGIAYFFGVHNNDMLEDIVDSRGNRGVNSIKELFKDKRYTSKLDQYLNQRNLMRPFSYGDERLDNHIAVAMAMNYGFDSTGRIRRLENLPEGSKSIYEMFSINDKAEVDFAMENPEEAIFQFRNAVRMAQRKIKGTMSDEDTNYAQRNLILNLMMQFKTWMPGVLTERFGKIRYNDVLDSMEGGRYRLLWSEMTHQEKDESAKTALYFLKATGNALWNFNKLLLTNNKLSRMAGLEYKIDDKLLHSEFEALKVLNNDPNMTIEDFRKLKEGQLRAAVAELEVLLVFTMMLFALGADWDDDGKPLYRDMYALQVAYKVLNRVKTEISFAYNPSEYSKLVTSPIPLSSLAVNAFRTVTNTADEIGDVLFGEDTSRFPLPFGANKEGKSDKTGKFHYALSFVPGAYQIRRLVDESFGPKDR